MTGENRNILNRILRNWPKGTVGTLAWFRDHGGYQQLLDYYQKAPWVTKIGSGVDWRASVPEECPVILPVLQKGRPGNFSLPSPVQTAVYRTELSLGIGVPSRMPPFHSDIFIRSQV